MSSKPSMPSLPDGMPDPDAIFKSWWPIIIALVGGVIYGLRQYFRGARCTSQLRLDDKIVVITGGNGGIGKYIAEDYAKRGAKVYIVCRNVDAGNQTVKDLKARVKSDKIFCLKCDLSSLKSVRDFVTAFKKKEESLHYLVNNAGVMMCPQSLTEDKFEQHFQVNYLGHFLLTHLLLDLLLRSGPSRIINITAPAYQLAEINIGDINFEKREYTPALAYAQSKLAVVLFTKEFAKQFKFVETKISMNCVIPGVVRTGIHRHMPFYQSTFVHLAFTPFIWFLMKHPEDGAQSTVFCSLAEDETIQSGYLYKECKRENYHEVANNEELQEKLWNASLKLLDITKFGETE